MSTTPKIQVVGIPTYTPGDNIDIKDGVISVLTTDEIGTDNTRPITAAGVQKEIGNIEILLKTI